MSKNQQETNLILKKRLNTFKSKKGSLTGLPDELIVDVIRAWEQWTGTSKSLCQSLGIKTMQIGFIIKKGKHLVKDGRDGLGPFIPVAVETSEVNFDKAPMILNLDQKKTISFYQVDHLVEFLKKVA